MNENFFAMKLGTLNIVVLIKQFVQRKKGEGSGKHNRVDGLYR